jgi:2,6-dihydroxypseudooxynicotine hydrolase
MASDPQVDLIFAHFTPRYIATGVDPNDLKRLVSRIDRWDDWCRIWSDEAKRHEDLAREAVERGRKLTAAEAWLRAAIYYHYGKHLFGAKPDEYQAAHANMLRCYASAAEGITPTMQRLAIPYGQHQLHAYLRLPAGVSRPRVAIILPGLDASKEELHSWSDAFVERGMATVTLDGPGQGECAAALPITTEWGKVIGAVIDVLERRSDVDGTRVGVVGQSLGAFYAPLSAALEPRLKACVANCGPFDFGPVLPQMPKVSQDLFRIRAHKNTLEEGLNYAKRLTLKGVASQIKCPLLIVFGAGDKIIPASEGDLLAKAAGGPVDFVVYEEGNHVCFNIPYKFRPLTADWMAEHL